MLLQAQLLFSAPVLLLAISPMSHGSFPRKMVQETVIWMPGVFLLLSIVTYSPSQLTEQEFMCIYMYLLILLCVNISLLISIHTDASNTNPLPHGSSQPSPHIYLQTPTPRVRHLLPPPAVLSHSAPRSTEAQRRQGVTQPEGQSWACQNRSITALGSS